MYAQRARLRWHRTTTGALFRLNGRFRRHNATDCCCSRTKRSRIYKGFDNKNATSVGSPKSNVYKGYSSAQFYQAGIGFCKAIETFSNPFAAFWATIGDYIAQNVMALVIGIIVAAIFALMAANSTKAKYSKKKPIGADKYLDRRNTRVVRQVDSFVREYTTSVRISSSSGGGGRSGGGGGHSGGHGGGGGRHR